MTEETGRTLKKPQTVILQLMTICLKIKGNTRTLFFDQRSVDNQFDQVEYGVHDRLHINFYTLLGYFTSPGIDTR